MLARMSGAFLAGFLLGSEVSWCALYFGAFAHLLGACIVSGLVNLALLIMHDACVALFPLPQTAFRAMLSTPELIRDFELTRVRRPRPTARDIVQPHLHTAHNPVPRSFRVDQIQRLHDLPVEAPPNSSRIVLLK